jgi:stress response protein YsnF
MPNRQSGAAHVPMMFFLLLLVLFLGAVGFAYVTQSKNNDLQKKLSDALADVKTVNNQKVLVQDYMNDIADVFRKPGKYEGRPGGIYGDAVLPEATVMNPGELKKVFDDTLKQAELSAATGIENVLGSLVTKIQQLNQRVRDAETARDNLLAEKSAVDKSLQEATASHSNKVKELTGVNEQQRSDFANQTTQLQNSINQVQENLKAKADELSAEKERALAKEKDLSKEIAKHQMQNSALIERGRLIKPADVADGEIIVANSGVPTAYINLGRKDMLQPGTIFRIKNPNSSAVKGYARVTEVMEERAAVALYDFTDKIGDYARKGDLLFNDLYSPRVTRTIYLMGRFSAPYNKPDLKNMLTRLGNKVVDKMQPGVDLVILGNDPVNEAADGFAQVSDSPEFKLASELRVEFAYLNTIRDLIKL